VLNFHEQKLTLGDFLEIQKQSVEEAEEPELEPEERIRTVVKLTEELRLIAVPIKVSENIDSHGQRAAETRLGIIRMLAGYEEILHKKFLSRQSQDLLSVRILPNSTLGLGKMWLDFCLN
jgi:hypothetical protein